MKRVLGKCGDDLLPVQADLVNHQLGVCLLFSVPNRKVVCGVPHDEVEDGRQVLGTIPQNRKLNFIRAQPVVEVLVEKPTKVFSRAIAGADEPKPRFDLLAANAVKASSGFYGRKQHRLRLTREVVDLVE